MKDSDLVHSIPLPHYALQTLVWGSFWGLSGVALSAFGAHGLKKIVGETLLETFKTGADYQMIHALVLILLGILQILLPETFQKFFHRSYLCFMGGIFFFSGNCYIYALSGIKIFAMLVPVGGFLLLLGWSCMFYQLFRFRRDLVCAQQEE